MITIKYTDFTLGQWTTSEDGQYFTYVKEVHMWMTYPEFSGFYHFVGSHYYIDNFEATTMMYLSLDSFSGE